MQWDDDSKEMDASDMDAHAGVLVVAYEKRNALRWYDPQKGSLLDTAEVPTPAGVAVGAAGTVFVSSGDRIVKLSQASKTPSDVVTGLDKPGRLDVDHAVVREWYGGQRWAPHATPEGDNLNVMWVGSREGWVMRVLVDYERKSWTVHSCYRYSGLADGLVGDSVLP